MTVANVTDSESAASKSEKARALIEQLAANGRLVDGYRWADKPQDFYCDQLGVSVRTFRNLIAAPGIVRKRAHVDGRIVTLLRVGSPAQKTGRDIANVLSAIWRRKVLTLAGRSMSRKEYGCCCALAGLAKDGTDCGPLWPRDWAPRMLAMVLDDWPAFMAGVKIQMAEFEAAGEGRMRYYQHPSLSVILRFWDVAVEMEMMQMQAKGEWPAAGVAECILSTS